MSKAVLLSIQPKWCELIASGKKTVEVRKTKPKLETPFKVYIYCTKAKEFFVHGGIRDTLDDLYRLPSSEIKYGYSGELMCYGEGEYDENNFLNGKVIGEFVCKKIDRIGKRGIPNNFDYCYLSLNVFGNDDIEIEIKDIKKSCIPKEELNLYGEKSNCLYAWHISDLIIYDKPKELGEFYKEDFEDIYSEWEDLFNIGVPSDCHVCYPPEPKEEVYIKRFQDVCLLPKTLMTLGEMSRGR